MSKHDSEVCRHIWDAFITKTSGDQAAAKKRHEQMEKLMDRTMQCVEKSLVASGRDSPMDRMSGGVTMLHLYIVELETRVERLEGILTAIAHKAGMK